MRTFNTGGPCKSDIHYMLPSANRLPQLIELIAEQTYFVIHAPRQIGKTTLITNLAQEQTAEGKYAALAVSMESGAAYNDDPGAAELAMLQSWRTDARVWLPPELRPPDWTQAEPGSRIKTALTEWALACPRPLVLFLDEIDALEDQTLISVLRQLRDGFRSRPRGFPWSLSLIGLRDVRDYKVASGGSERLHTASPFNIKTESLTLRNFTAEEVAALYRQHTAETGQPFTDEACARAFHLTEGQPWLVNAMARQAVQVLQTDRGQPITVEIINRTKEVLIARQDTHLDSLAERLREPRIRRVIEPIIAGQLTVEDIPADDIRFAVDLGLVRRINGGTLAIANPIYGEVIPYVLSNTARAFLPRISPIWLNPDGTFNAENLLEAFMKFWREHGEPLMKTSPYHEVAPHIVLMAFLHRVVNGGGSLEREYAVGSGRMDLFLQYGGFRLAMELKVWRDGRPDPLKEGLAQLDDYLSRLSLETGWLMIFDQRGQQPPVEDRTSSEPATTPAGRAVTTIRA
jgi:hypothetical protein